VTILADNFFGDTMGGALAGPTGLVVILLLVVGTIFLIRNMNARLQRLPDHFGDEPPADHADQPISADEMSSTADGTSAREEKAN
jgi:hypothetical protein